MCIMSELQARIWNHKVAGTWNMDLSAKKKEYMEQGLSADVIEKLLWFHRLEGIYNAENKGDE